ncbi:MAG TPA: pyruvate dehydrogenase (acetyl-transferring) E1 component subunit alpha [Tepidisphaeraceae bacterium]|nr:pyruvate dehydrogenase (acetyl-transferring) E1 component subunit alpha [Tepidisphaeraceae bacterium]
MTVADQVGRRTSTKKSDGRLERERLRMMILIRRFEERTYQEYTRPGQKIGGFCHLYSGQEAIAVGTAAIFDPSKDYLVNGYRCHGHSLALGMPPHTAMAELYGKATGCSKGKGGSMHLFQADVGNNGGHGIVGGQIPLGTGMAFAQWYKKTGGVTFCFMGDGAVNQGTFNEALNLGSLYKLPCIFIVENNGIAMGTQVERASAEKDLVKRGSAYAMPHYAVDGNDIDLVISGFSDAKDRAARGDGPSYIVANTYRFRGHSMSDPLKYRSKEEAERAKLRDPIPLYTDRLKTAGLITSEQLQEIEQSVAAEISQAAAQADADPFPDVEDRFNDVLAEKYPFEPR